jgi:hypothetical protein
VHPVLFYTWLTLHRTQAKEKENNRTWLAEILRGRQWALFVSALFLSSFLLLLPDFRGETMKSKKKEMDMHEWLPETDKGLCSLLFAWNRLTNSFSTNLELSRERNRFDDWGEYLRSN